MRIKCPCDRIAKPKVVNGVIMYIHKDDNTGCKLLNRFYTNKCISYVWGICKEAIEDSDYDTFNVYMCILSSGIRNKLLEYVSYANKEELIRVLTFLFSGNEIRADIQATLCNDMILKHGMVAYSNIRSVMTPAKFDSIKISRPRGKITKSTMCDISNDIKIKNNPTKQNIADDLARSFLIDKKIKDSMFRDVLKTTVNNIKSY